MNTLLAALCHCSVDTKQAGTALIVGKLTRINVTVFSYPFIQSNPIQYPIHLS